MSLSVYSLSSSYGSGPIITETVSGEHYEEQLCRKVCAYVYCCVDVQNLFTFG